MTIYIAKDNNKQRRAKLAHIGDICSKYSYFHNILDAIIQIITQLAAIQSKITNLLNQCVCHTSSLELCANQALIKNKKHRKTNSLSQNNKELRIQL